MSAPSNTNLYLHADVVNASVQLTNASGTGLVDLVTATTPVDVAYISATSTDTSAVVLKLYHHDGTNARLIGAVNVPTLSGTNGSAPTVDLLSAALNPALTLDVTGKRIFSLSAGCKLQVGASAAVTSAKVVDIVLSGRKF